MKMPPVITCDNCGLTYYQTTAPHVCAEWTKGTKEKDVSTRLLVTECFRGNHAACSGYNGPADNPNFTCDCNCHHEHEPVARGGEGEWRVDNGDGSYGYVWQGGALLATCVEPSRAEQIVTEHNKHHSLLAERERLREALEVAIHNLNAGNDPKFLADYLRLALDRKGK